MKNPVREFQLVLSVNEAERSGTKGTLQKPTYPPGKWDPWKGGLVTSATLSK